MTHDPRRPDPWAVESLVEEDPGAAFDAIGFVHRHRRGFAAVTVITALLALGAFFASRALPPVNVVASMDVTPTFPGAREGRYPNQAPYSPQDIIANAIVEPVWEAQGLEAVVPLSDLCRNLQIVSGGREIDQVRTEFVQKLSNSKLTAADRGALEAEFAARMRSMNSAALTISLAGTGSALSLPQMQRLLAAIPVEWARVTDAVGGRSYDYPVPNGKELRAAVAGSSGPIGVVVHAERLNGFASALRTAVDAMSRLPGSSGVRDEQGIALVDLSQELESTTRNQVIPAYLDALSQARKLDPRGYDAIRSTRKRLIESDLAATRDRAKVLREALSVFSSDPSSRSGDVGAGVEARDRAGFVANVDGAFIDRLVDQAVKSRNLEYQRELADRIVAAELDYVERKKQQEFESWLDQSVAADRGADRVAAPATAARLAELTDLLAGYSDRARAILVTLSARNFNPASAMFRIDMPPTVRYEHVIGLREIASAAAAAWFLGAAAVTLLGILADRRSHPQAALLVTSQDLGEHVAGPVASIADGRTGPRRLPAESRQAMP